MEDKVQIVTDDDFDEVAREKGYVKVYYGETEPENPKNGDIWIN